MYRSPVRRGNNKVTAGGLTGEPHREAPLARLGRGKDPREGPIGELRDLRRRSESGPGGQREIPVSAGAPRRCDLLGQRAGVPHGESEPVLMFPNVLELGKCHERASSHNMTKQLGVKGRAKAGVLALVRAPRLFLGRSFR